MRACVRVCKVSFGSLNLRFVLLLLWVRFFNSRTHCHMPLSSHPFLLPVSPLPLCACGCLLAVKTLAIHLGKKCFLKSPGKDTFHRLDPSMYSSLQRGAMLLFFLSASLSSYMDTCARARRVRGGERAREAGARW